MLAALRGGVESALSLSFFTPAPLRLRALRSHAVFRLVASNTSAAQRSLEPLLCFFFSVIHGN